jgi:hypothetical protein
MWKSFSSWSKTYQKGLTVVFGGLVTGGAALGILIACLDKEGNWYAFAPPGVGIVLFIGMTMLSHYRHPDLADAAIKHGLAAAFVGVYFTILGFSTLKTDDGKTLIFNPSLVNYLTVAVGAIVTAYFGVAAVTEARKQK